MGSDVGLGFRTGRRQMSRKWFQSMQEASLRSVWGRTVLVGESLPAPPVMKYWDMITMQADVIKQSLQQVSQSDKRST